MMNAPLKRYPAGTFLLRRYVELLTVFAVLFVLQTGLIPFDFFERPGEGAAGELFGATTTRFTIPDIISNLMLYLPVGVFLHWSLSRVLGRSGPAILLTIGLAAGMSGGIEWLQAYSPTRVSSRIDFVSNVLGAGLGVGLAWVARWLVPRMVGAVLHEFHARPESAVVKAYCGMLVFVAAMPFSFSFDVGLLKKSVESATWVPFGSIPAYETTAEAALAAGDYRHYAFTRWQSMKCWSRWAAEAVSFAALVWLAQPILRGFYGFRRRGATALIWWLCGGFAISLSGLHLIMVTRGFDVTDILFRWSGIAVGLIAWSGYDRPAAGPALEAKAARWRQVVPLGCAATLAYIVYTSVIPLTFATQENGAGAAVASAELLPFLGYFVTRFDLMMDDVMEKFVVYALFAALLVTCWNRGRNLPMRSRVTTVMIIGIMISIPLEVVQIFIPIRITSLTDLILAGCGCAAGVIAQEHAVRFYRFAMSLEPPTVAGSPRDEASSPRPSPTDVLVGTLLDEDATAPIERSGKRKRTPHR